MEGPWSFLFYAWLNLNLPVVVSFLAYIPLSFTADGSNHRVTVETSRFHLLNRKRLLEVRLLFYRNRRDFLQEQETTRPGLPRHHRMAPERLFSRHSAEN